MDLRCIVCPTIVILLTVVTSSPPVLCHRGNRFIIQNAINCSFTPVHNQSLVNKVYRYFDKDNEVKIIRYNVSFQGNGTKGWEKKFNKETFQPWRWYRTQGRGSSRLLLLNYYYYGLLKHFTNLDYVQFDVPLKTTPDDCLATLQPGDLDIMLSTYLLKDFYINENTVKHPFKYNDHVKICSLYIDDSGGWGILHYECCGHDEDDYLECYDVYEDDWVWSLKAFFIAITIILFLHFPSLIPESYRTYEYAFVPRDRFTFNLRLTTKPDQLGDICTATILKPHQWQKMEAFRKKVLPLMPDMTYTAHVERAHFNICQDRLLSSRSNPVHIARSAFDYLIQCKLRHSDPLEKCCQTSICGENDLNCPPWHAWLRALRTILVMSFLALPALPVLYAISADDLDFQELTETIESRGLATTVNFYPGHIFGRVISGILAFMYALNVLILVLDSARNSSISKMYTSILDISEKKGKLRHRIARGQNIIKKAFRPLRKHGIIILPLWLIFMALLPVVGILLYIAHSPMVKVLIHAFKKLFGRCTFLDEEPGNEEKFIKFFEIFLFIITTVFVFVVFTLGINFLLHVIALIIVQIGINEELVYHVFPMVLLLLFYLRDSFKNVFAKYAEHQQQIFDTLKKLYEVELRKYSLENHMLDFPPSEIPDDRGGLVESISNLNMMSEEREAEPDTSVAPMECVEMPENTNLFVIRYARTRMRLHQILLFLSSNDTLQMSKKFLFQTCDMDCPGCPGPVGESCIQAALDFLKIALFLFFVMLVIMAYGNAYYISPANHIFITLVSGILPILLRNVFSHWGSKESLNTTNVRFEKQFSQKIANFSEIWELEDIELSKIDLEDVPEQLGPLDRFQPGTNARRNTRANANVIDLILDISSEQSENPDTNKKRKTNLLDVQKDYGGKGSSCCCLLRSNAVEEVDGRPPKNNAEIEMTHRRKRPSIWNLLSGRGSSSKSSGEGTWRKKQEDEMREGHIKYELDNPNQDGPNVAAPSIQAETSTVEIYEMPSTPVKVVASSLKYGSSGSLDGSNQGPLKSSNDFRRLLNNSTSQNSISS